MYVLSRNLYYPNVFKWGRTELGGLKFLFSPISLKKKNYEGWR